MQQMRHRDPDRRKVLFRLRTPAPANDAGAGNKTAPLKSGLYAQAPNAGAGAAAKARNNKPLLIGAVALVVVVVLLVVLLKGDAGGSAKGSKDSFNSPEEAYEAFFNGYSSQDFDLMMSAFPDFWIEYFGGEEAERQQLQSNYENDWAGVYADGLQYISYRATGHTLLSEEEAAQVEQKSTTLSVSMCILRKSPRLNMSLP